MAEKKGPQGPTGAHGAHLAYLHTEISQPKMPDTILLTIAVLDFAADSCWFWQDTQKEVRELFALEQERVMRGHHSNQRHTKY